MKIHNLILIGLFLTACSTGQDKKTAGTEEINFRNDTEVVIIKDKDTVARFETEVADDEYERETGLMYRKKMKDNQAMLFIFPDEQVRYFYMKNTYLPLDVIFIDANGKIVSVTENAEPLNERPFSSGKPAQYVLEIKGGTAAEKKIEPGMTVKWTK